MAAQQSPSNSSGAAGDDNAPKMSTTPQRDVKVMPVDLRSLDYVNGFDRNLMCPICHCPFIEASRLACDHTFCQQCLTRALHAQSSEVKTCPSCRTVTNSADAVPVPRFIRHMVDDLVVKCPKHDEGCAKWMRRGDVHSHVEYYCEFADVACPSSECKRTVPRRDYSDDCLHVVDSCADCNAQVMRLDLDNHRQNTCTSVPSACIHCKADIPRSKLSEHQAACPKARISCDASRIGCNFVSTRAEVDRHKQTCPLILIQPAFEALASRTDQQDIAFNGLRHRNAVLETSLDNIQTLIDGALPPVVPGRLDSDKGPFPSRSLANPTTDNPPFDSATHHLLSLHESLREELDRVNGSVAELDARASMMVMNENLRLKEEMAHMNAVINSMRMQLQWLTSARLQAHQRGGPGPGPASAAASAVLANASRASGSTAEPGVPVRRLSDSSTKL